MTDKTLFVAGSGGLIGSVLVEHFARLGWRVISVDNSVRKDFFGQQEDTSWNVRRFSDTYTNYAHRQVDLRDRSGVLELQASVKPDALVHATAQPSYDRTASVLSRKVAEADLSS